MFYWRYWKWKKIKLKDNIKKLEDLSINLKQSIEEIKLVFEKKQKEKEEIIIEMPQILLDLEIV